MGRQRPLVGAAGMVVVVHAVALFSLSLVLRWNAPLAGDAPAQDERVEVIPVDEETVERVAAELERGEAPPELMGPAAPVAVPGQKPKEARFIARHDANPARETRARSPRNPRVEATPPAQLVPAEARGEGGSSFAGPDVPLPEGEGPRPASVTTAEVVAPPPPAQARGEVGQGEAEPSPAMEEPPAPPATPDLDLPVADDTAVRARASVMADFVRQVQQAVAHHWFPSEVYGRVDPGGTLEGIERRTVVRVRVRADGRLERTDVEARSGVPALDEEAREAFDRAQPFTRPPASVVDGKGGVTFYFSLSLDLAMARFKSRVKRMLRQQWRPGRVARFYTDRDRVTMVRALLTFEGVLAHVTVVSSAGSSFLDASALSAFQPGMRLPSPPAALGEVAGLVPVRIAFLHRIRGDNDVQVVVEPNDD